MRPWTGRRTGAPGVPHATCIYALASPNTPPPSINDPIPGNRYAGGGGRPTSHKTHGHAAAGLTRMEVVRAAAGGDWDAPSRWTMTPSRSSSLGTSILLDLRRVACGGCGSNWGLIECWEAHPLDPSLTERQARLNRLMGGSSRNNRAGGGCPEQEQTKRAAPIKCLPLRRLSKAEGGRPGRCSRQRLR